jgi:hypothetical protein
VKRLKDAVVLSEKKRIKKSFSGEAHVKVKRSDIVALVAGGGHRAMALNVMRDLEPVFRIVEKGSVRLADKSMLNHASVSAAIAGATCEAVNGIQLVSAACETLPSNGKRKSGYAAFMTRSLLRSRRASFVAKYGSDVLDRTIKPIWGMFALEYVETLRRSYAGFFNGMDAPLAIDVSHGPSVCMEFAAACAYVGARKRYAEMRDILLFAPYMLPVGSLTGSGDSWLVLVD